jgi:hypothetical protein
MPRSLTGVQPCRSTLRISSMMCSVIRREQGDAGDYGSTPVQWPGLLLDSRVVDVSMVYNLAFAMLSSLKLLFFKSLKKCVALPGQRGSIRPRNPIRACGHCPPADRAHTRLFSSRDHVCRRHRCLGPTPHWPWPRGRRCHRGVSHWAAAPVAAPHCQTYEGG